MLPNWQTTVYWDDKNKDEDNRPSVNNVMFYECRKNFVKNEYFNVYQLWSDKDVNKYEGICIHGLNMFDF